MSRLFAWSAPLGLELLPSNGLDRSLHLPVMVGLLIMAVFTETLGWTYAGLVVPGYLAAVFAVAPVTGLLVACEAVLAYLISALIGRWLPKTNAWSTLFGRERFLLIILVAVLVRLGVEASLLPWAVRRFDLSHSRELYSIGLVLVPLLANGFWNAGLRKSLPRIALVTSLTYVFIDRVLLEYTNFTVSRFQVANESVSLLFLDTPHAYIILVLGAILAARENVRFGWDYNGILVPALLAVACYQPTKLVTTLLEALVVLAATRAVTSVGPLSRALIVGPRRMVVAYTVGFGVKWLLGTVMLVVAPSVQLVDYFGFGYLLPTLLAVKMWSTDRVGSVLMPTVQVAVTSFLLGNVLAFGMRYISTGDLGIGQRRMFAAETTRSVALDLMLGDAAPAPRPPPVVRLDPTPAQQSLRIVRQLARGDPQGPAIGGSWDVTISVRRRSSGWWTIVPRTVDPNDDRIGPRVSLRTPLEESEPLLVVVQPNRVGAPLLVVAEHIAQQLGARAILVRSRLPGVRPYDDAFGERLRRELAIEQVMLLTERSDRATLSVVGALPPGLDVNGLGDAIGASIEMSWRPPDDAREGYANALRLQLGEEIVQSAAAASWSVPELARWPAPLRRELVDRLVELTSVAPGQYRRPSIEELRLFGRAVLEPWLDQSRTEPPSPWQRALAAQLGYRFASVGQRHAWALFEPPSSRRRGNATVVLRSPRRADAPEVPLAIEVPAPRWVVGAVDAGLGVLTALDAEAVLLSGCLPSVSPNLASDVRSPAGTQSFYQHAHEVWIRRGGRAVAIHGIRPDGGSSQDGVVAFEGQVGDPLGGPQWTRPIVAMLQAYGLDVAAVDGSLERVAFAGASNPAMSFSRRFGRDQTVLLWLSQSVRTMMLRGRADQHTAARLSRAGMDPPVADLAQRAIDLAHCATGQPGTSDCGRVGASADCELDAVVALLVRYNESRNPHALLAGLSGDSTCHVELVRDRETGYLWALAGGEGEVRLVPLRLARTLRSKQVITDGAALRGALGTDLGVLRVKVAP